MTIEVEVQLNREHAIFLAGEEFTVNVSFKNTSATKGNSLAWGCVQMHCERLVSRRKSVSEAERNEPSEAVPAGSGESTRHGGEGTIATSVIPTKRAIFSSKPVILFCDLALKPEEMLKFENTQKLPVGLPPTFKGRFVKIFWHICVAVQHIDAPIKMIRLPIKLLNLNVDVRIPKSPSESSCACNKYFPFLGEEANEKRPNFLELALNEIEEITSIRLRREFEIKANNFVFATVVLFKSVFKLGEDIFGRISFSHREIKCLQFLVRLESIEINLAADKDLEHITQYQTDHLVTAFIKATHFKLPIPLSITPSFTTEKVQLKWRLHFEFVTSTQDLMSEQDESSQLATDITVEMFPWDQPVTIMSWSPYNVMCVVETPSMTKFSV